MKGNPLNRQPGGGHYIQYEIQPIEFITKNKLGHCEGNVIKYVCRHNFKYGKKDLEKAIHYLELLIQIQYGDAIPIDLDLTEMNKGDSR